MTASTVALFRSANGWPYQVYHYVSPLQSDYQQEAIEDRLNYDR